MPALQSLGSLDPAAPPLGALFGVQEVAAMLTCSARHVRRLADAGLMPRPIKLGNLVRWRRQEMLDWIDAGCPARR